MVTSEEQIVVCRGHIRDSIVATSAAGGCEVEAASTMEQQRRWLDNQFLNVIFPTLNFFPFVQPLKLNRSFSFQTSNSLWHIRYVSTSHPLKLTPAGRYLQK